MKGTWENTFLSFIFSVYRKILWAGDAAADQLHRISHHVTGGPRVRVATIEVRLADLERLSKITVIELTMASETS